jgi:hypothetical protein
VFTETLPRKGLHNPVVLLSLGADRIENSLPYTVAYLEVFTDPLPGCVLIKSVSLSYPHKQTEIYYEGKVLYGRGASNWTLCHVKEIYQQDANKEKVC